MARLDLVIFGGTGFTGRYVVEQTALLHRRREYSLKWGIAGRSPSKMERLLQDISDKTGEDLSSVRVIVADVEDKESLKAMTAQAKVIVNCCGPYRHYGEPVVRACIATGTHHVDVTAELQFMQKIQLKYHSEAEAAGVYIVSACGLDCVPNDMGVVYLKQNFQGALNSVESYMNVDIPRRFRRPGTSLVHYGTYESLVYLLSDWDEQRALAAKLPVAPARSPPLRPRSLLHKAYGKWCLPFPGADASIVSRTQRHQQQADGDVPVQFKAYVAFPSLLEALLVYIALMLAYWMSKFRLTRQLLLKFPKLFSLGLISHEGPTDEVMNSMTFAFYLRGEGWDKGEIDVTSRPPNKTVLAKVSGVNPGYGFTAVALLHSALTILREQHKMPGKGGVMTTGMAFSKTSFINTLCENSYAFQIVDELDVGRH